MPAVTIQQLDGYAHGVISAIDQSLLDQNVPEAILTQYKELCRSDDARRLSIAEKSATNETRLRLRFECLCFSTFCAVLQSSNFITEKRGFTTRPSRKLIGLFDGALAMALMELCNVIGMSSLREITIVAVNPKPEFGFGESVDPLNRLEEYRHAFVKERGSELKRFGKWVAKALDPPNYPLFEIIGGAFGTPLIHLSHEAMTSVFIQ